ncbi:MAG: hypothetical protein ACUVX1_13355 [Chloroflexota bacterium]
MRVGHTERAPADRVEQGWERTQAVLADRHVSALGKYRRLVTGPVGLLGLLKYEMITGIFGGLPGLLGLASRRIFYRLLFQSMGNEVVIGQHVTIRYPHRIRLGNGVVIEDWAVLDAKGVQDQEIILHDGVFVGRGTILSARHGTLEIGEGASIGSCCRITASRIGRKALIAAYVYIISGGHQSDRIDIPIAVQPLEHRGRVELGDGCWVGAFTAVMPGAHVGNDAIVGAHSVVTRDVPPFAVAYGIPARVRRDRRCVPFVEEEKCQP